MTAAVDPPRVPDARTLELAITGMSCTSCAARIERKLNRLDGVTASVNYATETAEVQVASPLSADDLIAVVAATGYGASLAGGRPVTAPRPVVTAPVLLPIVAVKERPERPEPPEPAAQAIPALGGPPPEHEHGLASSAGGTAALRRRLVVAAALGLPVVLLAMIPALQFDYWQWVSLILATPVVTWAAWPFHRAAVVNARHFAASMDSLVSIGVAAAYLWSLYALVFGGAGEPGMTMHFSLLPSRSGTADEIYLEVAAGVTAFLLAGRYLEARAKRRSGAALRSLLEWGARDATLLRDGTEVRVPVEALQVGDRFVIRPGEKVATDGLVVEGLSAVDMSMMTGESMPIEVQPGDPILGGTVNAAGRLLVETTRIGADTQLAQMGRLLAQAQYGKARVQRLADRVSAVFVPVVLVFAVLTLLGWLLFGPGLEPAFAAAVAVLIVACPCALGLATPTALLVGSGRAAQLGILIKGSLALESTRRVDTVVLDKTGTVTHGRPAVVDVLAGPGTDRDEVLRMAAAVEQASEHPVAAAIVAAAGVGAGLPQLSAFTAVPGRGARGTVTGFDGIGAEVVVGSARLLTEAGFVVPAELERDLASFTGPARTVSFVGWDGSVRGVIALRDSVRPTSAAAVAEMRRMGLRPVLLTGDSRQVAAAVAVEVGIAPADVLAEVLPAGKVAEVRRLQSAGAVVAMVGDGLNDAPALAAADLGLAMGTGTDVAIHASDLTLVRADLTAVVDAIRLSRRTLGTIRANLFWAFAYNVAAIPLAAAGLLNPLVAGGAMALSSVFVVTNSLRLRRFAPGRARADSVGSGQPSRATPHNQLIARSENRL